LATIIFSDLMFFCLPSGDQRDWEQIEHLVD